MQVMDQTLCDPPAPEKHPNETAKGVACANATGHDGYVPETQTLTAQPARFRLDRLKADLAERGLTGIREQARFLGVAPSTIKRLMDGTQQPGLVFLAHLRRAWPKRNTDYWLDYSNPSTTRKAA